MPSLRRILHQRMRAVRRVPLSRESQSSLWWKGRQQRSQSSLCPTSLAEEIIDLSFDVYNERRRWKGPLEQINCPTATAVPFATMVARYCEALMCSNGSGVAYSFVSPVCT